MALLEGIFVSVVSGLIVAYLVISYTTLQRKREEEARAERERRVEKVVFDVKAENARKKGR
ncbi:hypothetical protein BH09VER1_BH09VER1_43400 [soil metagenome]